MEIISHNIEFSSLFVNSNTIRGQKLHSRLSTDLRARNKNIMQWLKENEIEPYIRIIRVTRESDQVQFDAAVILADIDFKTRVKFHSTFHWHTSLKLNDIAIRNIPDSELPPDILSIKESDEEFNRALMDQVYIDALSS